MQGYSTSSAVLVAPLFFGMAHLHHLHDLVSNQGLPLASAGIAVSKHLVIRICKVTRISLLFNSVLTKKM